MKKFVSKRRKNNGSKRIRRKNNGSKRRRYNKSKKNKKLIGGFIRKINDDTTLTLTYDLKPDNPKNPSLKQFLDEKQIKLIDTENLPLVDNNQPSHIVADQIKVEKTGEEAKQGELYSVTVVGNFGTTSDQKKTLRSIKLTNVSENILNKLLIKTLTETLNEKHEDLSDLDPKDPEVSKNKVHEDLSDLDPKDPKVSKNKVNEIVLSDLDPKDPEVIKNKVCDHLLQFFNKFTKKCSNSKDIEILKALGHVKDMKFETFKEKAKKTLEKLDMTFKQFEEETKKILEESDGKPPESLKNNTLLVAIKQFLCLEPIESIESTEDKDMAGGYRFGRLPYDIVMCLVMLVGIVATFGAEKKGEEAIIGFGNYLKEISTDLSSSSSNQKDNTD